MSIMEQYTLLKESDPRLEGFVKYEGAASPVAWHPEGWDWDNKEFILKACPRGKDLKEFTGEVISEVSDEAFKRWPDWEAMRFCLLRGQLFIDAAHDDTPQYAIFQPFNRTPVPEPSI